MTYTVCRTVCAKATACFFLNNSYLVINFFRHFTFKPPTHLQCTFDVSICKTLHLRTLRHSSYLCNDHWNAHTNAQFQVLYEPAFHFRYPIQRNSVIFRHFLTLNAMNCTREMSVDHLEWNNSNSHKPNDHHPFLIEIQWNAACLLFKNQTSANAIVWQHIPF